MSKFLNPGPIIVFLPTVPKQYDGAEGPNAFGFMSLHLAKAYMLNHWAVVFGPEFGFLPGIRLGCWKFPRAPTLATSSSIPKLYGKPLWNRTIPSRSQPWSTFPRGP